MFAVLDIDLKKDELESLLKSFFLFFVAIELLVFIIAYFYYKEQISYEEERLFLEMKNFNYTLKGDKFHIDIISKEPSLQTLLLHKDEHELFVYFPIPQVEDTFLKVIYPRDAYDDFIASLQKKFRIIFFILTLLVILLSAGFALYTLKPIRNALKLLEEFLKDIIHDLNTPVTAILLNSRLLRKDYKPERLERIELSAKTIVSLHKNLETFLRQAPLAMHDLDLEMLVEERVAYFQSIYPNLHFALESKPLIKHTSEDAMRRVLDNIISNACKYNRLHGSVTIRLEEDRITIEDSGLGIKDTKKIFDRFYKEGERGLGIGLHIVKKLCDELDIVIKVRSSPQGTHFILVMK